MKCRVCGNTRLQPDFAHYIVNCELNDKGERYFCVPDYRTAEQQFTHRINDVSKNKDINITINKESDHKCLFTEGPFFNMCNSYMACRFCGKRRSC